MQQAPSAIKAFVNSFGVFSAVSSLNQLADGVVALDLLSMVEGYPLEKQKIDRAASNWTSALNNIKLIIKSMSEYYQNMLNKGLPGLDWEPLEVCRNHNQQHIVRMYGLVVGVLTQASNKQVFISRILSLAEDHQAYFVQVIQNVMSNSSPISDNLKQRKLFEQLDAFEVQNQKLRVDLSRTLQLLKSRESQIRIFENRVESLVVEIQNLKAVKQESYIKTDSQIMGANLASQQKILIESLKDKLIKLSMEHQKEVIKLKEQMSIMESKVLRLPQLEALADMYKQNYQDALSHLEKINIWEKEKQKLLMTIQQSQQILSAKDEQISDLKDKLSRSEQQLLEWQMEHQRLKIRHTDLQNNMRKSLHLQSDKIRLGFGRHTLTELCPQMNEQSVQFKLQQALRDGERKVKKINDLQKQLSKVKLRAEKVPVLQRQKAKLQNIIIDLNNSKSEQISLLITCLYELRVKYSDLAEQLTTPVGRQRRGQRTRTEIS